MSFTQVLLGALLALLVSGLPANTNTLNATVHAHTPKLVELFTASAYLEDVLAPIPIPAGQRIVSNINNGSFSGPALSGTVLGGVSVFDIINNGSVLVNKVRNYGITLDGVPFFIDEDGTGSQADDFTRLTISIGGKYAYLANQLVIASAKLSSDKKIVTSTAYLVSEG